ncbi:MAG: hypothetical protein COV67_11565 [Nitrospinae bacterium CG11_big_fil_rev_8_21_14_0_20_56_8]|nr:MAG: hypothetical protein COV67_11565 [Nitrospinae bacterium CG11_big_fil_rev_8_21_14_0_20_56_8]
MKRFFILAQGELDRAAPAEIQIAKLGEFKDGAGKPFCITPEQVEEMIDRFSRRANDLVIDYHHQTLDGKAMAIAAGWIKQLIDKGEEGLWTVVEWTDRAAEYIRNREYRYLSPVFLSRKAEGETGLPGELHSAALTNDPAIDGMVPLVNQGEVFNDNPTKEIDMKEFLKKLSARLGLKEDASEGEIMDAVMACHRKINEAYRRLLNGDVKYRFVIDMKSLKSEG